MAPQQLKTPSAKEVPLSVLVPSFTVDEITSPTAALETAQIDSRVPVQEMVGLQIMLGIIPHIYRNIQLRDFVYLRTW